MDGFIRLERVSRVYAQFKVGDLNSSFFYYEGKWFVKDGTTEVILSMDEIAQMMPCEGQCLKHGYSFGDNGESKDRMYVMNDNGSTILLTNDENDKKVFKSISYGRIIVKHGMAEGHGLNGTSYEYAIDITEKSYKKLLKALEDRII